MTWLLYPLIAGVIAFGISLMTKSKREKKKAKRELYPYEQLYKKLMQNGDTDYYAPRIWSPYYSFEDNNIGKDMAQKAMKQRILDMPQLTFERWLTFYNNKPEAWVIQKDEDRMLANIPYYQKTTQHEDKRGHMKDFTVFVPTFWTNAEEMKKYRDWVETEYQSGKAAEFEQLRDKNMKILVDHMQEDIAARRAYAEAELQKMREQIQQPVEEKKEPVKLRLSDGTEVDVAPTYQGQPITKYNGHDTASYVQYRQKPGYIFLHHGKPIDLKGNTGDIRYDTTSDIIYIRENNAWVQISK